MRDGGLMNDPGGAFATNNSEIEFTVKAPKVRTTCVKVRQGFAIFNVKIILKPEETHSFYLNPIPPPHF